MAEKIPNPYLAAIKSAKDGAVDPANTLRTAFKKAATAMEAGAWVGGKADAFGSSLTGWTTTARSAASDALGEFDDAIAAQSKEPMVDPNSWQAHWHNLRP